MALVGLALGVAAAWLLALAAQSLLFGVEAGDPLALAGQSRPADTARGQNRVDWPKMRRSFAMLLA